MMQRKSVSIRGCIIYRVEVIVQLLHGKALCNICAVCNTQPPILYRTDSPQHIQGLYNHIF